MGGPLSGIRVLELGGIGPVPFTGMMLADMGAEVVRVERARPTEPDGPDGRAERPDAMTRGRRSLMLDLKHAAGREIALELVGSADVLLEGFRPGVMERLGLGPTECMKINPRLVYGRVTGWGQDGPLATTAGHDINYIALTGALWATGRPPDKPVPPLNLVGDYGGGGMLLAFGVTCGLLETQSSGRGQVVDAAMVDGAALLSTFVTALRALGRWGPQRGANMLDTGYPHYEVYECTDGEFVAVGALEPQFYAELVRLTGFDDSGDRLDPATFPVRKQRWRELFLTKSRDEWSALAAQSDACLTPVLRWDEAHDHPHLRARDTYVTVGGIVQPAPAPRFSRTPAARPSVPHPIGADTADILNELGLTGDRIADLRRIGAVA